MESTIDHGFHYNNSPLFVKSPFLFITRSPLLFDASKQRKHYRKTFSIVDLSFKRTKSEFFPRTMDQVPENEEKLHDRGNKHVCLRCRRAKLKRAARPQKNKLQDNQKEKTSQNLFRSFNAKSGRERC